MPKRFYLWLGFTAIFVGLCLSIILFGLIIDRTGRPASTTDQYGDSAVTFSVSQTWVLFPNDCVDVSWVVQGVNQTAFFPVVKPGISSAPGVRSVFFSLIYQPGAAIQEDAAGGTVEILAGAPAERTVTACIDYTSSPKLRVWFPDQTSRTYTLDTDAAILRPEVWTLGLGAVVLACVGGLMLNVPQRHRALRLWLWCSVPLLSVYAAAFVRSPSMIGVYALDSVIFTALVVGVIGLTVWGLIHPATFDAWADRLDARLPIRWLVSGFWLWSLSFSAQTSPNTFSDLFWLPFLLWALIIGVIALWCARRPDGQALPPPPLRLSLMVAAAFFGLSLVRDTILYTEYGLIWMNDSPTYLQEARAFVTVGASEGLPKRIFPYLLMNFLTTPWVNPVPLLILQSTIGALAVGMAAFVLSRYRLWLGIGVGLVLALDLTWGTYNRAILTESAFISFHVLCFAFIIWHAQRHDRLGNVELLAFGVLCGWTFLFRGTGLALIVPVALLYYGFTRHWRAPLMVVTGFGVLLLGVSTYNQWRYNEFGLVGRQHDTLASALFSYHQFRASSGPVSAEIDSALRACMGYLDYHDVPRFENRFIYGHFNACLLPLWGREILSDKTSDALQETILSRPLDYGRVLIEEMGHGLRQAISDEFYITTYNTASPAQLDTLLCFLDSGDCDHLYVTTRDPVSAIVTLNTLRSYPSQLYLAVEQVASRSPMVMLAAFLMFSVALSIISPYRLMIGVCTGFILYQVLLTSAAHTFIPRYGVVLAPFMGVLSVLALGALADGLCRARLRTVWGWVVVAVALVYLIWANGWLRTAIFAPLTAPLGVNLMHKYGINDADIAVYRALRDLSATALTPETQPARIVPFSGLGVVSHTFDLHPAQAQRIRGWEFTRLPGYLRQMGARYLLLNGQQWDALPPPDQALLNDPTHYRRAGEWHINGESRYLFEMVGDALGVYPLYEGRGIVLYEQADGALDVYRLDADRNGVFVVRLTPADLRAGQLEFRDEAGNGVIWTPVDGGGYQLSVLRPNGRERMTDFTLYLTSP